jgi:hypothetical protein
LSVGTGPTFVLDLSPKLFVGTILGNVNLQAGTTPGTPPGAESTPENQANLSLINPIISFNPSKGKLHGTAVLSVPTQYPPTLVPPTTVDVEIESTELGAFNGKLGYGPLTADFTLTLKYDTVRLERALSPAFAPTGGITGFWVRLQSILRNTVPGIRLNNFSDALQSLIRDVQIKTINVPEFVSRTINLIQPSIPPNADLTSLRTALSELATEMTNPGFNLSGNLRLGSLPISRFSAIAPTTRPLERPLLGAPAAFPIDTYAYGAIVAPPGSLFPFATPALGGTYSSFDATSGFSTTVGLLPTLSPSAITAGEPLAKQFPVYAYWEISYVRRVSNNLDLGIRFTAQVATSDLVKGKPETDPSKRFDQMLQDYQASQPGTAPPPLVPNAGLSVYGSFNLF